MADQATFADQAMPLMTSLYAAALRMTRNPADAEDLVQETYLRALRSFGNYAPGTNVRAWLFTILHRARVDALRRGGRRLATVELQEGDGPASPAPQESFVLGGLERAIGALPEALRSAVLLRDVEGFSYREIAEILEVPVGTVMSRLHRGRAALRVALGEAR